MIVEDEKNSNWKKHNIFIRSKEEGFTDVKSKNRNRNRKVFRYLIPGREKEKKNEKYTKTKRKIQKEMKRKTVTRDVHI